MRPASILIFTDWYLPGYKAGGPIRSISSLVEHLKEDFKFYIVTTDTDFGAKEPYKNIESNKWIKNSENVSVFYFSKDRLNAANIFTVLNEFKVDCIYLNSLFSYYFTIIPLRLIKKHCFQIRCVLAPRGMLGKGALQLKSLKKKLFITLTKYTGLYKNITWHATSDQEKNEIQAVFGSKIRLTTVSNLSSMRGSNSEVSRQKVSGQLNLVFISRISRKKNLHYTLQAILDSKFKGNVCFDIYGTLEDEEYWNKCMAIKEKTQGDVKIDYKGELFPEHLQLTIQKYHFMVLNTLNENFGHSIVEALISGCPVIISDQTPWKDLEKKKAGWDIALDDEAGLKKALQTALEMPNDEYQEWSQSAIKYAEENCFSKSTVEAYKAMFNGK